MSGLNERDAELHYCDNSHRWLAPPDVDQAAWSITVRAHVEKHRATMGGPPATSGQVCGPLRLPAGRPRRMAARPDTRAS